MATLNPILSTWLRGKSRTGVRTVVVADARGFNVLVTHPTAGLLAALGTEDYLRRYQERYVR